MGGRSSNSVRVSYPKLTQSDVIQALKDSVPRILRRVPLVLMVLYGSYAVKRFTAGSDIDLLVVVNGENKDKAYEAVIQEVGLPRLEPHIYTSRDYRALRHTNPRFARMLNEEGIQTFP